MTTLSLLQQLEQRHHFDEWRGRNQLRPDTVFIADLHFGAMALPEWRLRDALAIPAARPLRETGHPLTPLVAAASTAPAAPRCIHSVWRHPLFMDAVLNITSFECASREAAHQLLMHLLTQCQSPLIQRRDDVGIGDVTFAGPAPSSIVFARANLVHLMRNAGRRTVPIFTAAEQLDRDLLQRPVASSTAVAAALKSSRPAAASEIRLGATVRLPDPDRALHASLAADGPAKIPPGVATTPMHKWFATGGELLREQGLAYQPRAAGHQVVENHVVGVDGMSTLRRYDYTVA